MKIEQVWAMPNKETFKIKPIAKLLDEEMNNLSLALWADPFAGNNSPALIRNDLNPDCRTAYHLDALDFLKGLGSEELDGVLFDPPYSPRQVSECYKSLGQTVNMETTQSKFWGDLKIEIARVVKVGGKCISFGWNSGGIGKKYGFEITRILLVPHGGWHNDTIVTVEVKTGVMK